MTRAQTTLGKLESEWSERFRTSKTKNLFTLELLKIEIMKACVLKDILDEDILEDILDKDSDFYNDIRI